MKLLGQLIVMLALLQITADRNLIDASEAQVGVEGDLVIQRDICCISNLQGDLERLAHGDSVDQIESVFGQP